MSGRHFDRVTKLDREGTAYHEAGHFVAAYHLVPSSYRRTLTIRPDCEAGTLGRSESENPSSHEEELAEVVIYFAGFASERHHNPNADSRGAADDDENARGILDSLGLLPSEEEYRVRASVFVENHWTEIRALAEELLEKETIRDPFESELIMEISRGEATVDDLATFRRLRPTE